MGERTDLAVRHWAHRVHLYSCLEAGDLDAIDADLPVLVRCASESGDPALMWGAGFIRSWRALLAGDLESSEALAHEALSWGRRSNSPEAEMAFVIQLLEIRRTQDRLGGMEESLAEGIAADPALGTFRPVLAQVYCELRAA